VQLPPAKLKGAASAPVALSVIGPVPLLVSVISSIAPVWTIRVAKSIDPGVKPKVRV